MATRTQTFEHAISGVLARRAEMMEEIAETRKRLAILSNDIEAIDRTLEALGYQGEIKLTPRAARIVLFYRNELRSYCMEQLAEKGPQTSRQIGLSLVQAEGKDNSDRRMVNDIVRRVSKALRQLRQQGRVTNETVRGEFVWELV
jgi:hypothetical protein